MRKIYYIIVFIIISIPSQQLYGQWIWAKSSIGNSFDYGQAICTDAVGNTYITGLFQGSSISFGSFTLTNSSVSLSDIFIVKYDPAGNVVWAKSAGGNSFDAGQSICTDATGNLFVSGYFSSPSITFGNITLINANSGPGDLDFFIVKYDPAGNVIWARSADGGSSSDISTDANGNIYTTGYYKKGF